MKKIGLIIFLISIFILLVRIFPEYKKENNTEKKYDFYKIENEDRYKDYQKKNPALTNIEIITRVNLNLDLPFYTNTKEAKNLNTNQVFVNKYNYLKANFIPDNLEKIDNCSSNSMFLIKEAKEQFEKLCKDIQKENLQVRIISSYRSYQYQEKLYNKYVQEDGVEKADTYSARPGFSEHQTGLVVDLDNFTTGFENFENSEEFKWMQENSYKYGFILRYPKGKEDITGYDYESWHYRYVGIEIATAIHQTNLTFDEYYARFIENKNE